LATFNNVVGTDPFGTIRIVSARDASSPDYSFLNDTDTGMYNTGADELGFSTSGTSRLTISNNSVFSQVYTRYDVQAYTASGNLTATQSLVEMTSTGANTPTLSDGVAGQQLQLIYVAEGAPSDSIELTPTTANGFTDLTFNDLGDSCQLVYTSAGWSITGGVGVVIT